MGFYFLAIFQKGPVVLSPLFFFKGKWDNYKSRVLSVIMVVVHLFNEQEKDS